MNFDQIDLKKIKKQAKPLDLKLKNTHVKTNLTKMSKKQ